MKHLFLALFLLAGCPPHPPPPVDPVPPRPDGAAPAATCADVCRNLARLGCPGAGATPEGATCAQVCENVMNSGIITWDLECRTSANSCDAVDRCEETP